MILRNLFLIIIFCHISGETASNKAGVLQGQLNTPLNDLGIEQAKLAGSRLKTTKFDSVFASDLKRVLQTTAGIVKENESLQGISYFVHYYGYSSPPPLY